MRSLLKEGMLDIALLNLNFYLSISWGFLSFSFNLHTNYYLITV